MAEKHGLVISAPDLFSIAQRAAERSKDHDDDCVVAVVFAAAYMEALVNEVTEWVDQEIAEEEKHGDDIEQQLRDFVALGKEAEVNKGATNLKFMLASLALAGHSYERGSNPFQDYAVLMNLRNAIMHLKPSIMMHDDQASWMEAGAVLKDLEKRKLIERPGPHGGADLLRQVSRRAVADWAVDTAAAMAQSFIDMFPDRLREDLESDYLRKPGMT